MSKREELKSIIMEFSDEEMKEFIKQLSVVPSVFKKLPSLTRWSI